MKPDASYCLAPWLLLCRCAILAALLPFLGASEASAQTIYRCHDPVTGRATFSKKPCAPTHTEEVFPAAPADQSHPDVLALCTPDSREDIHVDAACGMMLSCRMGDRRACNVYCVDLFQPYFPDLRMDPTSPICLSLTGRKRGSNWVQTNEPTEMGGVPGIDSYAFLCVDSRGATFPSAEQVYCKHDTTECASELHELQIKTEPPEQLAAALCTEKHGTQLVQRPQRAHQKGREPVATAKRTGVIVGICVALAVLAAILLLRRRQRG